MKKYEEHYISDILGRTARPASALEDRGLAPKRGPMASRSWARLVTQGVLMMALLLALTACGKLEGVPMSVERAADACRTGESEACEEVLAWSHSEDAPNEHEHELDLSALFEEACAAESAFACRLKVSARLVRAQSSDSLEEIDGVIEALGNVCTLEGTPGEECDDLVVLNARRASVVAAEERRREVAERRERAAERRAERDLMLSQMREGEGIQCALWRSHASVNIEVCEALKEVIVAGRTSTAHRNTIRAHLRSRGLRKIGGYIIARIESGLYEAVMRGYDDYWGVSYPRGQHFILTTTATDYTSRGRFNLWVTKTGSRQIPLRNGFEAEWDIYAESTLGEHWQGVRDATAGAATSAAARRLLLFIAFEV